MGTILFITYKYPPSIGGMQKQSYELIRHIEKMHPVEKIIMPGGMFSLFFIFIAVKNRVGQLRDKENISLIHLNDGGMVFAVPFLRKHFTCPIFCTFHGLEATFPFKPYARLLARRMNMTDGIICVSSATRDACVRAGARKEICRVVNNGVSLPPPATTGPSPKLKRIMEKCRGKKVLLFVGRANPRKGVSWFLRNVFPGLDDNVVLLIVSPINRLERIAGRLFRWLPGRLIYPLTAVFGLGIDYHRQKQAVRKGPSSRVHFITNAGHHEKQVLYRFCDIFIMPNIRIEGDMEGFGLTALEASVNGCLVLAADIEGIRDAVKDNRNGLLVPSGDPEAWTAKIRLLLSDYSALGKMKERFAACTRENYSWKKMADEYYGIFTQAMS